MFLLNLPIFVFDKILNYIYNTKYDCRKEGSINRSRPTKKEGEVV